MKCLHICNDFLGSKVHENLYHNLNELGVEQTIFYPSRTENLKKLQKGEPNRNIKLVVSKPLKKTHRLFYHSKIKFLYAELLKKIDPTNFDIVHATTLFSDGALAYRIFEDYGLPYIVAVRGTDVGAFLKYRPDLAFLAYKILNSASKIVFISDSLMKNLYNHWTARALNMNFKTKNKVIYNGVDAFWLNNRKLSQKNLQPYRIIYIGKFDENKNALILIECVLQMRNKYPQLQIDLIGAGGREEKKIKELAKNHNDVINYHGAIYDQVRLKELIKDNHIFAMVSISETFGLVYLEALSQGLPILYSEGRGIDGVLPEKIGEGVDPKSKKSIIQGLEKIINDYDSYKLEKIDFTQFSWKTIGQTYFNLYKSILKSNLD